MENLKSDDEQIKGLRNRKERMLNLAGQAGNYILKIYFLILVAVYPFYMKEGYRELGSAKYHFFSRISVIIMALMAPVVITVFLCRTALSGRIKERNLRYFYRTSVTDMFVYGYLAAVLISYLFTDFGREAFRGAEGWYMGLVSQLIFVFIYFMFSRYFEWKNIMLYVMLISSGLVFLLGILNRYSVYPIYIETKAPDFISTLGNINWFCGYWAVLAPVGIAFYWISRKGLQRAAAGVCVVICFISGITQGSRSVYLALAAVFVLLFCISFQENRKMYRFLEICGLFALSGQAARLMRRLPGFTMNYEDKLGSIFTDTGLTLYIGAAVIIIYLLLWYLAEHKGYGIEKFKGLRQGVMILIAVIMTVYTILTVVNTCIPGGIGLLAGRQEFTFNDEWGNGRGVTWKCGLMAYVNLSPARKLIGVGPDCFADYVYTIPELTQRIYAEFGGSRLTNAHNEWITVLVNEGALGVICYAGIFISAFIRFIKKASSKPFLYLCAAGVLAYTVHNAVSFQQVLNTPFAFLVMGIGEGVLRRRGKDYNIYG